MPAVGKWTSRKAQQLACMAVGDWDHHSIRREIREARQGIRYEASLRLFPVGNFRGASLLKALNRLLQRFGVLLLTGCGA